MWHQPEAQQWNLPAPCFQHHSKYAYYTDVLPPSDVHLVVGIAPCRRNACLRKLRRLQPTRRAAGSIFTHIACSGTPRADILVLNFSLLCYGRTDWLPFAGCRFASFSQGSLRGFYLQRGAARTSVEILYQANGKSQLECTVLMRRFAPLVFGQLQELRPFARRPLLPIIPIIPSLVCPGWQRQLGVALHSSLPTEHTGTL